MTTSKKISVIGLGAMGSVLAELLLKSGHQVTVWNRTSQKAATLVEKGALGPAKLVDAILSSEIILVSVATYDASKELLRNSETEKALTGKILIQLSTGTPKDAMDEQEWAKTKDIKLLDGAIMVTPAQMGTPEAFLLVAGSSAVFNEARNVLEMLATNLLYTGEEIQSSSALDLAFLSYFFSALIGFTHAARIAHAEGLDITSLGTMIQNWSPAIGSIIKECSSRVAADDYQNPQSTLQTCYFAMNLISRHAEEANISNLFPEFATSIFKRGMDAGLALEEGSAIFKILK